ncbi:efflux RND transporter permease subunit [Parvularcula sp. IMCC14364]|uniref:efflux RND transporter permease subunit n=1 Tax=Parvularcula sp. IMCC14364 TaxID=3067902 RepID=UPI002740A2E6|nr:efflux RND transporter permease subunit [Parvularcula sp. IMCC14364]
MRPFLFDAPRALALVILLIFVGGLTALFTMPQEEDPKITNRAATILTPFPGAGAERVERLVTQRIEDELREIPEIDTINSTSRVGLSSVTVVLNDLVEDTEGAFSEIRDAVSDAAARLPEGALEPEFIDNRGYAYTVITALIWDAESDPNRLILKRTAEELQSRLRDVPGTEYVAIHGTSSEEIEVSLAGDIAQSIDLDERAIARVIANADSKGSAGQFFGETNVYPIEVRGELDTLDRVRSIPVSFSENSGIIRIGDIAEVRRSLVSPASNLAYVDGRAAVVVGTRMQTGLRVGQWSEQVRQELAAFDSDLSQGIELRTIFDQAEYAGERFGTLILNLLFGVGLVVIILFFTLGFRSALLVTFAIPMTALASLMMMNLIGQPINQMSVTGLIVALGLLVDAAIVVSDAVARRLSKGLSARAAVAESVERLWVPLLSSTITTVLAFLPITLLPGPAGEFVGPIADSVIIALISSYLIAITVIAALAGLILRKPRHQPEVATDANPGGVGLTVPFIGSAFSSVLKLSLKAPRLSMMAAMVFPILGFIGVTTLPSQFFPEADRNQFHVELKLSPQSSIEATVAATRIADAVLEAHPEIVSAEWFVGSSAPSFYYNVIMNTDGAKDYAEAMVTTRSLKGLKQIQSEMQDALERALPDVQVLVRTIVQGPPTEAPVELRITGRDLGTLQELGEQARAIFAEIPEIVATEASIPGGQPKLWLEADEDSARQAGLTLGQVAGAMSSKLQGAQGGSIIEGETEIPVIVRLSDQYRRTFDEVGSITVTNPAAAGQAIAATPVSSLGELKLRPAPATITHYQAERVNRISGYVRPDALPSTAVEAFQKLAAERDFTMPPGYSYGFGGDAEARSDAVGNLLASVGLIVIATIATIVLTFNSFRLMIIVFAVAGFAMGLGMLSLTVFGYPFGFQPIIALMGLMGVAINAAIIILSGLRNDPAAVAGDIDAIRDGVLETARHITSTTLTTFAGFLPLILSEGGFWPPFATAIAGGVLLSTIVSFFFVPQAFLVVTRGRPVRAFIDGRPAKISLEGALHA